MARILIAAVPIHGHVTPLLAIGRRFVDRGDDVRFVTGSRFAAAVAATGAEHIPLPADADFDDRRDFDEIFPQRAALKGAKAIAFDIENVFIAPTDGQYRTVIAAHAERPVDVVLADPAFGGAAILLGHPRRARPAVVMCGVIPLSIDSRDTAPYGLGLAPARLLNRPRNKVLDIVTGRILATATRRADDAYRAVHGTDLPFRVLNWGAHADAIVQFTVPAFDYPRSDAPTTLRFSGPITATGSASAVPDWWADLDGSRPVVHVTQGTIANKDWSQLVAPTLTALADQELLVVVSTGGRPIETLPPLPPNARAAEYLPYDDLLARTDVYVTNGGYGGVQYALRHGVPIVATGGKEDKPEVGARVAWSGVGRRLRTEHPSPKALRRTILRVLRDDRHRAAARRMATEIASSPGFDALAETVDGLSGRS